MHSWIFFKKSLSLHLQSRDREKKKERKVIAMDWEKKKKREKKWGPAETWTRIFGFKVQGANHYTTGPNHMRCNEYSVYKPSMPRITFSNPE